MPQDRRHQHGARQSAPKKRGALPLVAGALLLALIVAAVAVVATTRGDDDGQQASAPTPDVAVTWTAEPFSGGPRLAVDQTRVDHGAVAYGEQVQAVYRLRNVGDEELRIGQTSVNTLEGC